MELFTHTWPNTVMAIFLWVNTYGIHGYIDTWWYMDIWSTQEWHSTTPHTPRFCQRQNSAEFCSPASRQLLIFHQCGVLKLGYPQSSFFGFLEINHPAIGGTPTWVKGRTDLLNHHVRLWCTPKRSYGNLQRFLRYSESQKNTIILICFNELQWHSYTYTHS